jgi:DNA polymerase
MPDDPTSYQKTAELLADVERFLRQEQGIFGDTILLETATMVKEPTVRPPKTRPAVEEPTIPGFTHSPEPFLAGGEWNKAATIDNLNAEICDCTKCSLGHTRTKFVFGVGNPKATLMIVGEAPGADEDAQGEPFVGRAGQLLNKILEAINFKRQDVYICNILKCRPPNNRPPQPDEVEQCIPYLRKQIELVQPRIILCLGLTAAHNLLQTSESLGKLRGRILSYENVPLMVTYHPAALLRNPNWKRPAWEDVQALRKLHDELIHKAKE